MIERSLASKNGIVGICQHGDLLWGKIPDQLVNDALNLIDAVAPQKIAQRQKASTEIDPMDQTCRTDVQDHDESPHGLRFRSRVRDGYGLGAPLETQDLADKHLPHLVKIQGWLTPKSGANAACARVSDSTPASATATRLDALWLIGSIPQLRDANDCTPRVPDHCTT